MIASMRALLFVLASACGGDEPEDNAVDATEQNTVELAGARYRVVLFRQLSLGAPPDDALAFGQRFEPRRAGTAHEFEYSATELEPGECTPAAGSAADRTFDGGVLVFEVPFDSTAERPMVLEIGDPAGPATARIQLDL